MAILRMRTSRTSPGLASLDGYGAGEDVAARAAVGGWDLGVDVAYVGGDVGWLDAEGLEALGWAAGGEGLDDDRVSGVDGEDGFGAGGVVSPGYGGWGGEEGLCLLGGRGEAEERGCGEAGKEFRFGFSAVHFVSVPCQVGGVGGCDSLSLGYCVKYSKQIL